ncbi:MULTISPECIES: glutamate racemase [Vreelandella]|uniref:Glutamate racemase n=2 Tax=Vreelandella TaxID=3137766 RepID=A0A7C9NQV7_9GAMM|nr:MULTISPECIES: glutamate racemase [Halomonas]NDL70667.1 glutamate racemase [Halomonas alkaliphila]NYS44764.1 glutamate racemase [Halomonas zhaodongensis]
MKSGPVLMFDSGVGGLSVAHALRQHYPELPMCYACDNAWLPYGLRDDVTLSRRIVSVCKAAVDACQASVLVVACNTASTLALEGLRATLDIPVVGTVPAIKPAARSSQTRHIGLLATTATVNRPYTQALIDNFASDCVVTKVAADALVTEAEAWLSGAPLDEKRLQQALLPLWQATQCAPALDTVVLGCTHFPLLKPMLVSLSPSPLIWVDSGDAIARRVGQVAPSLVSNTPDGRCFTTAPATRLIKGLARYGFQSPQLLTVSKIDGA